MLILILLGSLCIVQCFHHEAEVCHLRRYFILCTAFCSFNFHSLGNHILLFCLWLLGWHLALPKQAHLLRESKKLKFQTTHTQRFRKVIHLSLFRKRITDSNLNMFANDTQFCLPFTSYRYITLTKLTYFLMEMSSWMKNNCLKINQTKIRITPWGRENTLCK